MKITKLEKNNCLEFNLKRQENSFWQSNTRIKILLLGNQAECVFVLENDDNYIIAEKRKITLGFGIFCLGIKDCIIDEFKQDLKKLAKDENCLFVQFETLNYDGYKDNNLKLNYYKKFITPYTALIDLKNSEDEIKSLMKPKGRYNIKVAQKHQIKVKIVEKTRQNVKIFYDLMIETTSRDGFSGNTFSFYENFLNASENNLLLIAYKGDIPLRAGIFVYTKDVAIYYYGASSSDKNYRNMMSSYLLQWTAILEAKKRGCILYDFLGIASLDDRNSPLAGVTDFKMKLTNDSRFVSKSEIVILNKFKYFFIMLIRKFK